MATRFIVPKGMSLRCSISFRGVQNSLFARNTFCPYTGDIFALKTEDSKLKKKYLQDGLSLTFTWVFSAFGWVWLFQFDSLSVGFL